MEKIQATLVLEILGRPAEHIKSALSTLVERMSSEKGVKVTEKIIHEPTEVKDTKDLYTAFAEVTVEFDAVANYFGVLFAYMPSHIEIISPEKIELINIDLNELGNKLLARLHDYDALTKKAMYERDFLLGKLKEVAPEVFKKLISHNPSQVQAKAASKKEKKPKKKSKLKK